MEKIFQIVDNITGAEMNNEEFQEMISERFFTITEGEILKGKILSIKQDGVIVDIGYKSEGFIPLEDFSEKELLKLIPGEEIDVYVQEILESEGMVFLSRRKAMVIQAWDMIESAYRNGSVLRAVITERVKGGFLVDFHGVKGFIPASHVDIQYSKNPDEYVGNEYDFKVISFDRKKNSYILSRKLLLEEEKNRLKEETLKKLVEGNIIKGKVKNITNYGVFVDLGGIDGLLHISDISWGKVTHPSQFFRVGQTIETVVLKYDQSSGKVTLGYKQKRQDPWLRIEESYRVGEKVKGRVTSVTDYGLFVEIEDGVEGLVHISELDWSNRQKHPAKYASPGDHIDVVIIGVDKEKRRLSLSLKQAKQNPWQLIAKRYAPGQRINVKVVSFTDFGAFVELPEGVDGLIHISDLSWTKHISHPSEVLRKGQKIEVVVLNVQPEKEKISLGLKQLTEDPWIRLIPERYKVGDEVDARVIKITEFGVFVDIESIVEGLIYSSEIPEDVSLNEIKVGDVVRVRIIKVDKVERKIGLSLKNVLSRTSGNGKDFIESHEI